MKESNIAFFGSEIVPSDYHALKTYLRKRRSYKEYIERVITWSKERTFKNYLSFIEKGTYSWLRAFSPDQRKRIRQIMENWLSQQKLDFDKKFNEDNIGFVSIINFSVC